MVNWAMGKKIVQAYVICFKTDKNDNSLFPVRILGLYLLV
jgi:hypothetical protein